VLQGGFNVDNNILISSENQPPYGTHVLVLHQGQYARGIIIMAVGALKVQIALRMVLLLSKTRPTSKYAQVSATAHKRLRRTRSH
jgi:hypothetical protein